MSQKPINPASPLPWEYDGKELREERSGYAVIYDATGKIILDTMNSEVAEIHHGDDSGPAWWDETGRKDLLFVMRAANCHHALVAALKEAIAQFWGEWVNLDPKYMRSFRDHFPDHTIIKWEKLVAEAEGTP